MDTSKPVCCELAKEQAEAEESNEETQQSGPEDEHWWLDLQLIERLPVNLKKGKDSHCDVFNPNAAALQNQVGFGVLFWLP